MVKVLTFGFSEKDCLNGESFVFDGEGFKSLPYNEMSVVESIRKGNQIHTIANLEHLSWKPHLASPGLGRNER